MCLFCGVNSVVCSPHIKNIIIKLRNINMLSLLLTRIRRNQKKI